MLFISSGSEPLLPAYHGAPHCSRGSPSRDPLHVTPSNRPIDSPDTPARTPTLTPNRASAPVNMVYMPIKKG